MQDVVKVRAEKCRVVVVMIDFYSLLHHSTLAEVYRFKKRYRNGI